MIVRSLLVAVCLAGSLITSRWYVPSVRARWGDRSVESSGGWIVRFDARGRVLGGWNRLNGSLLEVERDSSGRLVAYRVRLTSRDEGEPPASFVIEIERDAQGRWTRERLASDSAPSGWNREVTRELDERGRVVRSSLAETTRHGDTAPVPRRSSVATYSYGEGCGVVEPPQPEGHDALLESPVEPRPG